MTAWAVLLAAAALPVALACGYLLLLAAFAQRRPPPPPPPPGPGFDVVVPAHDEEGGIGATVKNLLALDYPRHLFRIVVVADNCRDQTAQRAEEAGAQVLVRDDPQRRGKGYALAWAFAHSLERGADAVVVVDADTVASPNLLSAFAARLRAGAGAIQADYGVRNPAASWRTRLMTIALAAFHVLRSLARERLALSCGLRGNGMCFSRQILREVPHEAFSIVEDLEYGIRLGEAGHRVHYAEEAHVYGDMVATERASRSQRERWEGGRLRLAGEHGLRLLASGLQRRDPVLIDLAIDVLVPPLSLIALAVAVGVVSSAVLANRGGPKTPLWLWAGCALALAGYVLRAWKLSGTGARGLLDLLCAPLYIAWKATLLLRRNSSKKNEWIRTQRERPSN